MISGLAGAIGYPDKVADGSDVIDDRHVQRRRNAEYDETIERNELCFNIFRWRVRQLVSIRNRAYAAVIILPVDHIGD